MIARPVSIGRLRLHPEQPLSITAEDVVVGNPPGFPSGEEPLARTPRATVRLDALASLRQRKVVITSIELQRPVLRAVATENGRNNYSDLINAAGAGGVEALIRRIRILDGKARVVLRACTPNSRSPWRPSKDRAAQHGSSRRRTAPTPASRSRRGSRADRRLT